MPAPLRRRRHEGGMLVNVFFWAGVEVWGRGLSLGMPFGPEFGMGWGGGLLVVHFGPELH